MTLCHCIFTGVVTSYIICDGSLDYMHLKANNSKEAFTCIVLFDISDNFEEVSNRM